jgi:hypothetical protein
MSAPGRQTPEWLVERLAAGELPEDRAADVRARLATEPGGEERLRAIAESNGEILARLPPAAVAAAVRGRVRRRRIGLLLAPAMATAAVIAVIALRGSPGGPGGPGGDGAGGYTGIKGAPSLVIHRQRDLAVERLTPGALVRERDLLQVAYQAAGRSHGVVLSLDGAGKVTLHLPVGAADAGRLAPGGPTALPEAFELDAAPGFERFFFVTARSPFAVAPLLEAARALGRRPDAAAVAPLALPAGLEQTSFLLRKVDR